MRGDPRGLGWEGLATGDKTALMLPADISVKGTLLRHSAGGLQWPQALWSWCLWPWCILPQPLTSQGQEKLWVRLFMGTEITYFQLSPGLLGHGRKWPTGRQARGVASGPTGVLGGQVERRWDTPAYDHVLQRMLGQPAVQKHGDEEIPQRRPEYLRETWVRGWGSRWPLPRPAAHPP